MGAIVEQRRDERVASRGVAQQSEGSSAGRPQRFAGRVLDAFVQQLDRRGLAGQGQAVGGLELDGLVAVAQGDAQGRLRSGPRMTGQLAQCEDSLFCRAPRVAREGR